MCPYPAITGPLAIPATTTSHALTRIVARGDDTPPALAELERAAAILGRAAWYARVEFDDLLVLVGDLVDRARASTPDRGPHAHAHHRAEAPEADAALLYLWRVTGQAYQTVALASAAPAVRRTAPRPHDTA